MRRRRRRTRTDELRVPPPASEPGTACRAAGEPAPLRVRWLPARDQSTSGRRRPHDRDSASGEGPTPYRAIGADGYVVDAWPDALLELVSSTGRRPSLPNAPDYIARRWPERAVVAASRYVVYPWRRTIVRLPERDLFTTSARRRTGGCSPSTNRPRGRGRRSNRGTQRRIVRADSMCADRSAAAADRGPRTPWGSPTSTGSPGRLRSRHGQAGAGERRVLSSIRTRRSGRSQPATHPRRQTVPRRGLTVLVEEMDDLAMKLHIRICARPHAFPWSWSPTAATTVIRQQFERFDLDPESRCGRPGRRRRTGRCRPHRARLPRPPRRPTVGEVRRG